MDASFGSNGFTDFVVEGAEVGELHSLVLLRSGNFVTAGHARYKDPSAPGYLFVPLLLSCDDRGGVNPGFNGGNPVLVEGVFGNGVALRWMQMQ